MAYDEGLAERVRRILAAQRGVVERQMFGGLAFMVHGHMCCGVNGDELMLRVGPAAYAEVLAMPHAREMDFTKRPMRGFVYVETAGFEEDEDLRTWIDLALNFALSLKPKSREPWSVSR